MVLLLLVVTHLCPVDALCGVVTFIITLSIVMTSVLGMIQGWNGREVNWFACQER